MYGLLLSSIPFNSEECFHSRRFTRLVAGWDKGETQAMANNGNRDFTSVEHRTRNTSTQQEHSTTQAGTENSQSDLALSRSLLSDSRINSSANSALRASSIQGMQQTHGNRAVQRSIQQSASTASVPVQREWDQKASDQRMRQGNFDALSFEGLKNSIEAIPGFGNGVSALMGVAQLGGAGINALMGDKPDVTDDMLSRSGYEFMHAVPLLGNYLAGRDSWRDYDSADKALSGDPNAGHEGTEDKFRNTGMWDYITGNF